MKRKFSLSAVVALVLIAVLLTFLITNGVVTSQFNEKLEELDAGKIEFQKLSTVDSIVREHYAYKVDEIGQSEGSIAGYVSGLGDAYSRYMTADEYAEYLLSQTKAAEYTLGFSAAYHEKDGTARICHVESRSEAAKIGISVGDRLISVGDVKVKQGGFDSVAAMLTGEKNETTSVTVKRDGESVTYSLTYSIQKKDRVSARLVLGQAALISIRSFEEGTKDDLKSAIDSMIASGADALVFDVRGVHSVDFDQAVACVDVIAGMGDLARVVSKGETIEVLSGDGASVPLDCSVLIDAETYGAPELFAACLRDAVEAKVLGSASAGCASVQADIKLNDMSAILLTTRVYMPPVSDGFEGVGVQPDVNLKNEVDFRALSFEDDLVVCEGYYLLKPEKRPGENDPIVVPDLDEEGKDPSLIEPGMEPVTTDDEDKKNKK